MTPSTTDSISTARISKRLDAPVTGISHARRVSLIQVLGAITYGELKAFDGAKENADNADNEEDRRTYKKIAAEELRHHKGFSRRLVALGADVERAMRPYESSLDTYHVTGSDDAVVEGVSAFLGEGIAADLLTWLRKVADEDTAAFIDTVIEDEVGHEAHAAARLRELLEAEPGARERAEGGVRRMLTRMITSGTTGGGPGPFTAFLRLGRPAELVTALVTGQARRLRMIGLSPVRALVPISLPVPTTDVLHFAEPAARTIRSVAGSLVPAPLARLARINTN